jgi:hypothetical protein
MFALIPEYINAEFGLRVFFLGRVFLFVFDPGPTARF